MKLAWRANFRNILCVSDSLLAVNLVLGPLDVFHQKGMVGQATAIENIFGNWEESYNKLPGMLQALQMYVPGFIWKFNTQPAYQGGLLEEGNVIFKRLFWTFKPCIDGFAFCKPIVQVDGTFLYGKYKGTLLFPVAQDGRNNIICTKLHVTFQKCSTEEGCRQHRFFYYYNIVRDTNAEAAQWLDNFLREKWTLAWDNGRRWGHMTTNLVECINSVLKKTRNLPIYSMVMAIYTRCNKFFVQRGREVDAMINTGHVYLEIASKTIQDAQSKANTHRKVYIPCSHVLVSCLHARHNYQTYIEDYWLTYIDPTMWPNPELKRTSKGRPKYSKIKTEMDIREQHNRVKNCSYRHTSGHTRKTCPNIGHGFSSRHHCFYCCNEF
uniref:MULE transposase domain-containing protein n=1 Tax=Cajanus cajan TaxID=3821 RepID=A0A151SM39_CAJCA|nr:hypothetical protein KK1_002027 [Cajanus cajan]